MKLLKEISPVSLSEFAKYFSKSSETTRGAFGVYQIAEKNIDLRLPDLTFSELIKISSNLIPQNIGSNQFYNKLEQQLLQKFPSDISIPTLVKLFKALSNHRFVNTSLSDKLIDTVENNLQYMTVEQIQIVLWSISKSKKGSLKFHQSVSQMFQKYIRLMNARGISFGIYGFCMIGYYEENLFNAFETEIFVHLEQMNVHNTFKILQGLNKLSNHNTLALSEMLIQNLQQSHEQISITGIVKFCEIMLENEYYFQLPQTQAIILKINEKIIQNISNFSADQLCLLYYFCVRQNNSSSLSQVLIKHMPQALDVPKNIFCQTVWSYVEQKEFVEADQFIITIQNLSQMGNIKYFFNHENFIYLIWSTIMLDFHQRSQSNSNFLDFNFWESIKDSLLEINPNTLKPHSLVIYMQSILLINKFVPLDKTLAIQKRQEIRQNIVQNLLESDLNNKTDYNLKLDVLDSLQKYLESYDANYQHFINFVDDFLNPLDLAFIFSQDNKIGITILNKYHFKNQDDTQDLLLSVEIRCQLLQNMGWKILFIEEKEWNSFNESEKQLFIEESIQL